MQTFSLTARPISTFASWMSTRCQILHSSCFMFTGHAVAGSIVLLNLQSCAETDARPTYNECRECVNRTYFLRMVMRPKYILVTVRLIFPRRTSLLMWLQQYLFIMSPYRRTTLIAMVRDRLAFTLQVGSGLMFLPHNERLGYG